MCKLIGQLVQLVCLLIVNDYYCVFYYSVELILIVVDLCSGYIEKYI